MMFLDYSTLKRHLSDLWRFKSRFLKGFCVLLKESFQWFIRLLYAISTFLFKLFIKENSCSRNAKAMYGVFVIIALNS